MRTIFKTLFGSHLYGTNTENSDKDYKGIFIETIENIILKKDKHVIHETTKKGGGTIHGKRNDSTDIETEYKELREFLKDCMQGQTYALDMLFAPYDLMITNSREWTFIQNNRQKLLSKNVQPYIGYCRQQAGKYGLKGSRLGELLRVIEFLEGFESTKRLFEVLPQMKESEFARTIQETYERKFSEKPITETFLEVLGKKYEHRKMIKEVLPSLKKLNELYGSRAKLALQNEGVDWKAVSHAFRCCYQLIELAETQEIKFPLKHAEELKLIKTGSIPYVDLQEKLHQLMEKAIEAINKSSLPETPDKAFWDKYIIEVYKSTVISN